MANELKHLSVGTELTQAEFEATGGHVFDSQATGDIPYASSAAQISRLPIGSTGYLLSVAGGIPVWVPRDIGARVYNNADLSIPNSVLTALTFNTERWDTDTIHDTSTNPERLTCKTAGKYIISANIRWDGNATEYRALNIYLNGVDQIGREVRINLSATALTQTVTTIYDLAVNDYLTVVVFQASGGALLVTASVKYSPEFMMQRIG
jgi:hypothetical protein